MHEQKKDNGHGHTNPIQSEWHQRQVSSLMRNERAMLWLEEGLRNATGVVERFGIGLTPPAKDRDYQHALAFPRVNEKGLFVYRYLHYNLPGVTSWAPGTLPRDKWGTKPAGLYYSGAVEGKTTLIIVSEPKAVWGSAAFLLEDVELRDKALVVSGTRSRVTVTFGARRGATKRSWRVRVLVPVFRHRSLPFRSQHRSLAATVAPNSPVQHKHR